MRTVSKRTGQRVIESECATCGEPIRVGLSEDVMRGGLEFTVRHREHGARSTVSEEALVRAIEHGRNGWALLQVTVKVVSETGCLEFAA